MEMPKLEPGTPSIEDLKTSRRAALKELKRAVKASPYITEDMISACRELLLAVSVNDKI